MLSIPEANNAKVLVLVSSTNRNDQLHKGIKEKSQTILGGELLYALQEMLKFLIAKEPH
jgi:hypothetical protein